MDFDNAYASRQPAKRILDELSAHGIRDAFEADETIFINQGHPHDEFILHADADGLYNASNLFDYLGY